MNTVPLFSTKYTSPGNLLFIYSYISVAFCHIIAILNKLLLFSMFTKLLFSSIPHLYLPPQDCGADCAKFQKSELEHKFNKRALERPYTSKHSWGKTYGEHKRHLEFSHEEYRELQKYAEEVGIFFTASGMDEVKQTFDEDYITFESGLTLTLTSSVFRWQWSSCMSSMCLSSKWALETPTTSPIWRRLPRKVRGNCHI